MFDEDDLSGIVVNLNRRDPVVRGRLANHPLTRSYLEAGTRLVDREFFAVPTEGFTRPLATLTRETVIAEVADEPSELAKRSSVGSFRDRWAYFPDYLSDLARYTLRIRRWSLHTELAEQAVPALSGGDFVAALEEIAYRDMVYVSGTASTAMRFRFLLTAWAEQDEQLRGAMTSVYRDITDHWSAMCESVFAARGLRLRPGVTFEQLSVLLTALAEGLALRAAGDPGAPMLDHERRRSILGTGAMALFAGMVDSGDGRELGAVVADVAEASERG
ncbi:hypothetical protein Lfu02_66650 [Longispora fulva]|uniref:Uncharacterized protein n=1 Tax=Longispora fulva TaxID=619741 RepID=A0A8J7KHJ5_9ACTN|nr:hypothetical protein [Longispora fulva]MBG6138600.1 hypothetical protein [Longispora fulva]GIG62293.1 hypothetical protein Lfu02_66650 [Longispora fulva]